MLKKHGKIMFTNREYKRFQFKVDYESLVTELCTLNFVHLVYDHYFLLKYLERLRVFFFNNTIPWVLE